MEFCIPWQNWNIEDIHYGLHQVNTRIESGLFVPIYYTNQTIRCQAFHVLTPALEIRGTEYGANGVYLKIHVEQESDFAKALLAFDDRNLTHATGNKNLWWPQKKGLQYQTAIKQLPSGDLEWRVQIPETGIFTCFDTKRKCWYASNESNLENRKWKIVARTSGLWIDANSFGMEWKLIGAFVI